MRAQGKRQVPLQWELQGPQRQLQLPRSAWLLLVRVQDEK